LPYRRGVPQRQQSAGKPKFFQGTAAWPAGRLDAVRRHPAGGPLRAFNLGVGKNMGYFGACRWISPRPTPPCPMTAIIRGSRCVSSITNR
jgi:hypothetical protein